MIKDALCDFQIVQLGLYLLQNLWVGYRFHLARPSTRRGFRLWSFALSALRPVRGVLRIDRLALFAFVVRDAVGPEFVARVSEGIFVLFRRVSRAVSAANVTASLADFGPGNEQCVALVASPPDTLTRFLVDEILAARLAGAFEHKVLVLRAVVGLDRRVLTVSLDLGSSPFSTSNDFGLGALRWVTRAFGATGVVAVGAFLASAKGSVAAVTGSANAHSNGLVHAQDSVVGDSLLPFHGLNLEAKPFIQLLGSLLEKLQLGELANSSQSLVRSSRLSKSRGGIAAAARLRSNIGFRHLDRDRYGSDAALGSRSWRCGSCLLTLRTTPPGGLDLGEDPSDSRLLLLRLGCCRRLCRRTHGVVGWCTNDDGCLRIVNTRREKIAVWHDESDRLVNGCRNGNNFEVTCRGNRSPFRFFVTFSADSFF